MKTQILYILKSQNLPAYKVGITDDVRQRLKSIEKDFGKINYTDSLIYTCNNRKLIEKFEGGIHAFLSNHYYAPENLGGGSTEWFEINSFDKCVLMLNLYEKETSNLINEGTLQDFLTRKTDFTELQKSITKSRNFIEIHSEMINQISNLITRNCANIVFNKRRGYYVLSNIDFENFEIFELPMFQWVTIKDKELLFDIKVYNEWKKSGIQKELRGLVEIKFFSEYALNNLPIFFKEKPIE